MSFNASQFVLITTLRQGCLFTAVFGVDIHHRNADCAASKAEVPLSDMEQLPSLDAHISSSPSSIASSIRALFAFLDRAHRSARNRVSRPQFAITVELGDTFLPTLSKLTSNSLNRRGTEGPLQAGEQSETTLMNEPNLGEYRTEFSGVPA